MNFNFGLQMHVFSFFLDPTGVQRRHSGAICATLRTNMRDRDE